MWHCQQACVWGFQQWAMRRHMAFFQNKQPPVWHGTMSSKTGRATTTPSWLGWSQAPMTNFCYSRASKMPRKASVVCQWLQRNCIAVLVRNPTDWSPDASSHNHLGSKEWLTTPMLACNLSDPVTRTSSPFAQRCGRPSTCSMPMPTGGPPSGRGGGGRMGVRWRGLAWCISFLPYELGRGFVLHCDFLPPWMATTSFYDLHWLAFWSPPCSHILQSIQSFCGGFITSICLLFDELVFWWCSCDRPQVLQRIRSTCDADTQHPFGYSVFRREMPEDAECRHLPGPWSWFRSSSC